MSEVIDPLWPEFRPLWHALREAGGPILLAGGYGLFLKQQWLRSRPDVRTVVRLEDWPTNMPRVTKDVDIVVGLEVIASHKAQSQMSGAMGDCGFAVTAKNPRWQFEKRIDGDRWMLVEFHAPLPDQDHQNLDTDRVRVKHKPSLGEDGIHGRQNPEAVGCDHHPFQFNLEGVTISVPNPVTWCVMKLTAMADRFAKAEDESREDKRRAIDREQAAKHATDVCRIVALTTREENDHWASVVSSICSASPYLRAVDICRDFFLPDGAWGAKTVANMWRAGDLGLLRDTLAAWFSPPET